MVRYVVHNAVKIIIEQVEGVSNFFLLWPFNYGNLSMVGLLYLSGYCKEKLARIKTNRIVNTIYNKFKISYNRNL